MKTKFVSANKFGFIKRKSAECTLLEVSDRIYNDINSGLNKLYGDLMILRRPLIWCTNTTLLNKMEVADIREAALNWFQRFIVSKNQ